MPAVPLLPEREDSGPRLQEPPLHEHPTLAPAIKGEEPKPGWAQASSTDRLMTAAVAGEDRDIRHLPEPEAHRRLQVFALSPLHSAELRHVLLQEPRAVANGSVVFLTSDSTTRGSFLGLISSPLPASLPLFISGV